MELCKKYFKDIVLRIGLATPINNPCNPRNTDSKINRFLSKTMSGYADTIEPTEDKEFKFGPGPEENKIKKVKKTKEDQDKEDQERHQKRLEQIEERSRQRSLQLSAREYLQNIREIQPGTFLPGEVIFTPTGSFGNAAVGALTTVLSKSHPSQGSRLLRNSNRPAEYFQEKIDEFLQGIYNDKSPKHIIEKCVKNGFTIPIIKQILSELDEILGDESEQYGGTVFEKLHANKELQIKNNNAVILSNNKFKGGTLPSDITRILSEIKSFISNL